MTTTMYHDVTKPFTGEGDVMAWLTKVQLVSKLQKIYNVAHFLPLYLKGNANDQDDVDMIQAKLITAFTDGPFIAFSK